MTVVVPQITPLSVVYSIANNKDYTINPIYRYFVGESIIPYSKYMIGWSQSPSVLPTQMFDMCQV